jgi:hypothetical protein
VPLIHFISPRTLISSILPRKVGDISGERFGAVAQVAKPNVAIFAQKPAKLSSSPVLVVQLQLAVDAHAALTGRTNRRPRMQLPQLAKNCHLRALTWPTTVGAVGFCTHFGIVALRSFKRVSTVSAEHTAFPSAAQANQAHGRSLEDRRGEANKMLQSYYNILLVARAHER